MKNTYSCNGLKTCRMTCDYTSCISPFPLSFNVSLFHWLKAGPVCFSSFPGDQNPHSNPAESALILRNPSFFSSKLSMNVTLSMRVFLQCLLKTYELTAYSISSIINQCISHITVHVETEMDISNLHCVSSNYSVRTGCCTIMWNK